MTDQLVLTGFTPFDPAFAEDPYPAFTALRERSPVHHVEQARLAGVALTTTWSCAATQACWLGRGRARCPTRPASRRSARPATPRSTPS